MRDNFFFGGYGNAFVFFSFDTLVLLFFCKPAFFYNMNTLSLVTIFISFLGFVASFFGAILGYGQDGNLLSRVLRPMAEIFVMHPVFFAILDTFLAGLTILVPVLVSRDTSKEAEEPEHEYVQRFLVTMCVQSAILLVVAITIHDVVYVWSMPVLMGLYLVRSIVLGLSRMYLVKLPRITIRDLLAASILNIHLFWAAFLFYLSLSALVGPSGGYLVTGVEYVTFLKYTLLFFIGLFSIAASITILSDIHLFWIVVTIDVLVATYPFWSGTLVPFLFMGSIVLNTIVLLYTMPCLILVMVRHKTDMAKKFGLTEYLRDGFNFWNLIERYDTLRTEADTPRTYTAPRFRQL